MASQSTLSSPDSPAGRLSQGQGRVVILYKRGAQPDEELSRTLEKALTQHGHTVFLDRHLNVGVEWAREIERQICHADAVVVLLSPASVQSEMLGFEVEIAADAAQRQGGRPRLLPVRVRYEAPLPEELSGILASLQYCLWRDPANTDEVITAIVKAVQTVPAPASAAKPTRTVVRVIPKAPGAALPSTFFEADLEPIGGAVPLNSKFYVHRKTDDEFRAALGRQDSIILVKGARQMGKTSLLARGLQQARERGARIALTDFQKLNAADLESVQNFFLYLAESVAEQLDITTKPQDVWEERRGASVNFERYLRREVLKNLNAHLVWGLDEVDRLFSCSFGTEVFGLFRSWHNERALDPAGPWAGVTLAIAYATEAHLFITDMNQSPFNVGTRLAMEDFTLEQVVELNQRHGNPLQDAEQVGRLIRLVRGHPFLVRRALHEIVKQKLTIQQFEESADRDDGIFGDHLRRILVLLAKDPGLLEIVRGILRGQPCPNPESFYRLRSAGVMAGGSPTDVRPRCEVYASFLKRHLL